jgi:hypothetical protein
MKKCENCGNKHDGLYGSGRFCGQKCARAFSSKEKRQEINEKVSQTLKRKFADGTLRGSNNGRGFTAEERARGNRARVEKRKQNVLALYQTDWNQLVAKYGKKVWKHFLVEEQGGKCLKCKADSKDWMGQELVLELDHIDGNKRNDKRKNLRMLCPNCHSQTETYCKGFKNNRA